jgi:membrane protein
VIGVDALGEHENQTYPFNQPTTVGETAAVPRGCHMLNRLLASIRARFPFVDTAMRVNERVGMIGGGPLASSITLAGFLSLFPLLLVGIAVVGFFAADDVNFASKTVEEMGLEGRAADRVLESIETAERSRRSASVVGFAGMVWSGLAVVGALGNALNAAWQVKGRGFTGKLWELAWLVGAGALFVGSLAAGPLLRVLPGPVGVASVVLGLVLDVLLMLWTFHQLANVHLPWRVHLPGAIAGGLGLTVLKLIGGFYVPMLVSSSSSLYGSIGVVFALLAWMALGARLLVYSATYNVVRYERDHGTVTVDLEVPHIAGEVPLEATRGGAVAHSASAPEDSASAPESVGAPAASG